MIKSKLKGFAVLTFACLGVTACGGSDNDKDEDTSKTDTYVQFYNATVGSTATALKIGDKTYESVSYADAMPRFTSTPGVSEVEVMGKDAANKDISLYKREYRFKNGNRPFLCIAWGFLPRQPFLNINYSRTELDKQNAEADKSKMQLLIAHTATDAPAYDAYIAKADKGLCRCSDARQRLLW